MKIIDLLNAQPVMQKLMDRQMPVKLAYCLAKNFRLITTELEDYNTARLKLLREHWVLNPKTDRFDIPDEDQSRWKKMHDELADTESGYKPFKVDMALAEKIDWAPGELLSLWFIFEGEGSSDLAPVNTDIKVTKGASDLVPVNTDTKVTEL